MERTASFLGAGRSLSAAIDRVRRAEALGFDGVWITQTATRDALGVLAEYAHATQTVRLGTGVLPIYARTPVSMAQAAATLGEVSEGRFVLGIGVSHRVVVENVHGQPYERPLRDMREYLTVVRAILRDGHVGFAGERYRAGFAWRGYEPPFTVPVYISALSPRMLRLGGELADGVILWCCTPDYVRDVVVPNVRAGAEGAGRDPAAIEIVAAVPVSATENPDGARAALRRDLVVYWTLPNYRAAIARAGFGADIEAFDAAMSAGGAQAAQDAIPEAYCEALAAVGDAETLRAKVREYRDKGVTLPAAGPFSGHEGALGAVATLDAVAPA